jgi:hypothetical protein
MFNPLDNWNINFNKAGYISKKECYDAGDEIIFYNNYKYRKKSYCQRKQCMMIGITK